MKTNVKKDKITEELLVKSDTEVKRLANAIIVALKERTHCTLVAVGPMAVNQAIKGLASANGLASAHGEKLVMTPYFQDRPMKNNKEIKTVMVTAVEKKKINFAPESI